MIVNMIRMHTDPQRQHQKLVYGSQTKYKYMKYIYSVETQTQIGNYCYFVCFHSYSQRAIFNILTFKRTASK